MNERHQLETARRRLLAVLADIAQDAERHAGQRCPYRALDDRCTFPAACRNHRRVPGLPAFHCSGASLNTAPAAPPTK